MEIVPRHQLRAASLRHHEVISLCNTDMNRVLSICITCIPFREEGMAGQDPVHTLVHQGMQQPEHDGIPQIRSEQRCRGIAMHQAAEDLRRIRIVCQSLGDRFRPEVQTAPGRMSPAVQERHG